MSSEYESPLIDLAMAVHENNLERATAALGRVVCREDLVERWYCWHEDEVQVRTDQGMAEKKKRFFTIDPMPMKGCCNDPLIYDYLGAFIKSIEMLSLLYRTYIGSFDEKEREGKRHIFMRSVSLHGLMAEADSTLLVRFLSELRSFQDLGEEGRAKLTHFQNFFLLDKLAFGGRTVLQCIHLHGKPLTSIKNTLIFEPREISYDQGKTKYDCRFFNLAPETQKNVEKILGFIHQIPRHGVALGATLRNIPAELQNLPYFNNVLCFIIVDTLRQQNLPLFRREPELPPVVSTEGHLFPRGYNLIFRWILSSLDEEGNTILHRGSSTNLLFLSGLPMEYAILENKEHQCAFDVTLDTTMIIFYADYYLAFMSSHRTKASLTFFHSIKTLPIARYVIEKDREMHRGKPESYFFMKSLEGNPAFFNPYYNEKSLHGKGVQAEILKHLRRMFGDHLFYLDFLNTKKESIFFHAHEKEVLLDLMVNYPNHREGSPVPGDSFKTLLFCPNEAGDYVFSYTAQEDSLLYLLAIYRDFFGRRVFPPNREDLPCAPELVDLIFSRNPRLQGLNYEGFLYLFNGSYASPLTTNLNRVANPYTFIALLKQGVPPSYVVPKEVTGTEPIFSYPLMNFFGDMNVFVQNSLHRVSEETKQELQRCLMKALVEIDASRQH